VLLLNPCPAGLLCTSELLRTASAAALTVAWSQPRRMLAASTSALDVAWRQPRRVLDASNTALDAACDVAWRAPARRICEASNAAMKVARQQPQRVLQASNAALGWGFGLLPLQARPRLGSKVLAYRVRIAHTAQTYVPAALQRAARVQRCAGLRPSEAPAVGAVLRRVLLCWLASQQCTLNRVHGPAGCSRCCICRHIAIGRGSLVIPLQAHIHSKALQLPSSIHASVLLGHCSLGSVVEGQECQAGWQIAHLWC
jgi:hypothetical protein